jgi:hypothetical protein
MIATSCLKTKPKTKNVKPLLHHIARNIPNRYPAHIFESQFKITMKDLKKSFPPL